MLLAERTGFEPAVAFTTPPFQDGTFDHSDISPYALLYQIFLLSQYVIGHML